MIKEGSRRSFKFDCMPTVDGELVCGSKNMKHIESSYVSAVGASDPLMIGSNIRYHFISFKIII